MKRGQNGEMTFVKKDDSVQQSEGGSVLISEGDPSMDREFNDSEEREQYKQEKQLKKLEKTKTKILNDIKATEQSMSL